MNSNKWQPITLKQLNKLIKNPEGEMLSHIKKLWMFVKLNEPKKWEEQIYGKDGGGLWVVAVCGQRIVWYNDIEDGFNISLYETLGYFDDYFL